MRRGRGERKADVASGWFIALKSSGFGAIDSASLRRDLGALAGRAIDALATRPFPGTEVTSIGAELGRLPHAEAAVLGDLLNVLVRELAAGLDGPDTDPSLSLAPLLSGLAAGFAEGQRTRILAEQDVVHRAVFEARRQAEAELRASEDRYRAVVTQAAEGIVLTDAETGRILETNPAFQRLVGFTADELVGLPLHRIVAHRPASVRAHVEEVLRSGRCRLESRRCRCKDGSLVTVEASITAVSTGGGTLLCAAVRDITERQRAEAELEAARAAVAESREAERLRLARELHDGVVQELLGLRYQLAAGAGRPPGGPSDADLVRIAGHVGEGLAEVVGELREMIGELRPPGIADVGLRGALENWLPSLTGERTPEIVLDVAEKTRSLPPATALCLFRAVQESVRNAVEHAGAERVVVHVRPRGRQVILRVFDDGRGFEVPERLDSLARRGHFGLAGIVERVSGAKGRLRVRSRPGRGTAVAAWLPLPGGE